MLDWLAEAGLTRTDPLLVVGGGIVQDVGGFAAHLFKRGLPWTYVPTTLLSQCDSCIGAKAGVNHGRFKNQLALFAAPRQVVIDPSLLATLAPLELRSGLGEIVKLHLTGGPFFADRLVAAFGAAGGGLPSPEALRTLTWDSLVVKRAVIERDEFELDHRRALNYGHTIGHAIENLSGFAIPHGQAIGFGMAIVNRLAVHRGLLAATHLRPGPGPAGAYPRPGQPRHPRRARPQPAAGRPLARQEEHRDDAQPGGDDRGGAARLPRRRERPAPLRRAGRDRRELARG